MLNLSQRIHHASTSRTTTTIGTATVVCTSSRLSAAGSIAALHTLSQQRLTNGVGRSLLAARVTIAKQSSHVNYSSSSYPSAASSNESNSASSKSSTKASFTPIPIPTPASKSTSFTPSHIPVPQQPPPQRHFGHPRQTTSGASGLNSVELPRSSTSLPFGRNVASQLFDIEACALTELDPEKRQSLQNYQTLYNNVLQKINAGTNVDVSDLLRVFRSWVIHMPQPPDLSYIHNYIDTRVRKGHSITSILTDLTPQINQFTDQTLVLVMILCAKQRSPEETVGALRFIHTHVAHRIPLTLSLMNRFIANFSLQNDISGATLLYDELANYGLIPDQETYQSMYIGFARMKEMDACFSVFSHMQQRGITLDISMFEQVIEVCIRYDNAEAGLLTLQRIQSFNNTQPFMPNGQQAVLTLTPRCFELLIRAYLSKQQLDLVMQIYYELRKANLVLSSLADFNLLLELISKNISFQDALQVMADRIQAFEKYNLTIQQLQATANTKATDPQSQAVIDNAKEALTTLPPIPPPDISSFNILLRIAGLSDRNLGNIQLIISEIQRISMQMNTETFNILIESYASLKEYKGMKYIYEEFKKTAQAQIEAKRLQEANDKFVSASMNPSSLSSAVNLAVTSPSSAHPASAPIDPNIVRPDVNTFNIILGQIDPRTYLQLNQDTPAILESQPPEPTASTKSSDSTSLLTASESAALQAVESLLNDMKTFHLSPDELTFKLILKIMSGVGHVDAPTSTTSPTATSSAVSPHVVKFFNLLMDLVAHKQQVAGGTTGTLTAESKQFESSWRSFTDFLYRSSNDSNRATNFHYILLCLRRLHRDGCHIPTEQIGTFLKNHLGGSKPKSLTPAAIAAAAANKPDQDRTQVHLIQAILLVREFAPAGQPIDSDLIKVLLNATQALETGKSDYMSFLAHQLQRLLVWNEPVDLSNLSKANIKLLTEFGVNTTGVTAPSIDSPTYRSNLEMRDRNHYHIFVAFLDLKRFDLAIQIITNMLQHQEAVREQFRQASVRGLIPASQEPPVLSVSSHFSLLFTQLFDGVRRKGLTQTKPLDWSLIRTIMTQCREWNFIPTADHYRALMDEALRYRSSSLAKFVYESAINNATLAEEQERRRPSQSPRPIYWPDMKLTSDALTQVFAQEDYHVSTFTDRQTNSGLASSYNSYITFLQLVLPQMNRSHLECLHLHLLQKLIHFGEVFESTEVASILFKYLQGARKAPDSRIYARLIHLCLYQQAYPLAIELFRAIQLVDTELPFDCYIDLLQLHQYAPVKQNESNETSMLWQVFQHAGQSHAGNQRSTTATATAAGHITSNGLTTSQLLINALLAGIQSHSIEQRLTVDFPRIESIIRVLLEIDPRVRSESSHLIVDRFIALTDELRQRDQATLTSMSKLKSTLPKLTVQQANDYFNEIQDLRTRLNKQLATIKSTPPKTVATATITTTPTSTSKPKSKKESTATPTILAQVLPKITSTIVPTDAPTPMATTAGASKVAETKNEAPTPPVIPTTVSSAPTIDVSSFLGVPEPEPKPVDKIASTITVTATTTPPKKPVAPTAAAPSATVAKSTQTSSATTAAPSSITSTTTTAATQVAQPSTTPQVATPPSLVVDTPIVSVLSDSIPPLTQPTPTTPTADAAATAVAAKAVVSTPVPATKSKVVQSKPNPPPFTPPPPPPLINAIDMSSFIGVPEPTPEPKLEPKPATLALTVASPSTASTSTSDPSTLGPIRIQMRFTGPKSVDKAYFNQWCGSSQVKLIEFDEAKQSAIISCPNSETAQKVTKKETFSKKDLGGVRISYSYIENSITRESTGMDESPTDETNANSILIDLKLIGPKSVTKEGLTRWCHARRISVRQFDVATQTGTIGLDDKEMARRILTMNQFNTKDNVHIRSAIAPNSPMHESTLMADGTGPQPITSRELRLFYMPGKLTRAQLTQYCDIHSFKLVWHQPGCSIIRLPSIEAVNEFMKQLPIHIDNVKVGIRPFLEPTNPPSSTITAPNQVPTAPILAAAGEAAGRISDVNESESNAKPVLIDMQFSGPKSVDEEYFTKWCHLKEVDLVQFDFARQTATIACQDQDRASRFIKINSFTFKGLGGITIHSSISPNDSPSTNDAPSIKQVRLVYPAGTLTSDDVLEYCNEHKFILDYHNQRTARIELPSNEMVKNLLKQNKITIKNTRVMVRPIEPTTTQPVAASSTPPPPASLPTPAPASTVPDLPWNPAHIISFHLTHADLFSPRRFGVLLSRLSRPLLRLRFMPLRCSSPDGHMDLRVWAQFANEPAVEGVLTLLSNNQMAGLWKGPYQLTANKLPREEFEQVMQQMEPTQPFQFNPKHPIPSTGWLTHPIEFDYEQNPELLLADDPNDAASFGLLLKVTGLNPPRPSTHSNPNSPTSTTSSSPLPSFVDYHQLMEWLNPNLIDHPSPNAEPHIKKIGIVSPINDAGEQTIGIFFSYGGMHVYDTYRAFHRIFSRSDDTTTNDRDSIPISSTGQPLPPIFRGCQFSLRHRWSTSPGSKLKTFRDFREEPITLEERVGTIVAENVSTIGETNIPVSELYASLGRIVDEIVKATKQVLKPSSQEESIEAPISKTEVSSSSSTSAATTAAPIPSVVDHLKPAQLPAEFLLWDKFASRSVLMSPDELNQFLGSRDVTLTARALIEKNVFVDGMKILSAQQKLEREHATQSNQVDSSSVKKVGPNRSGMLRLLFQYCLFYRNNVSFQQLCQQLHTARLLPKPGTFHMFSSEVLTQWITLQQQRKQLTAQTNKETEQPQPNKSSPKATIMETVASDVRASLLEDEVDELPSGDDVSPSTSSSLSTSSSTPTTTAAGGTEQSAFLMARQSTQLIHFLRACVQWLCVAHQLPTDVWQSGVRVGGAAKVIDSNVVGHVNFNSLTLAASSVQIGFNAVSLQKRLEYWFNRCPNVPLGVSRILNVYAFKTVCVFAIRGQYFQLGNFIRQMTGKHMVQYGIHSSMIYKSSILWLVHHEYHQQANEVWTNMMLAYIPKLKHHLKPATGQQQVTVDDPALLEPFETVQSLCQELLTIYVLKHDDDTMLFRVYATMRSLNLPPPADLLPIIPTDLVDTLTPEHQLLYILVHRVMHMQCHTKIDYMMKLFGELIKVPSIAPRRFKSSSLSQSSVGPGGVVEDPSAPSSSSTDWPIVSSFLDALSERIVADYIRPSWPQQLAKPEFAEQIKKLILHLDQDDAINFQQSSVDARTQMKRDRLWNLFIELQNKGVVFNVPLLHHLSQSLATKDAMVLSTEKQAKISKNEDGEEVIEEEAKTTKTSTIPIPTLVQQLWKLTMYHGEFDPNTLCYLIMAQFRHYQASQQQRGLDLRTIRTLAYYRHVLYGTPYEHPPVPRSSAMTTLTDVATAGYARRVALKWLGIDVDKLDSPLPNIVHLFFEQIDRDWRRMIEEEEQEQKRQAANSSVALDPLGSDDIELPLNAQSYNYILQSFLLFTKDSLPIRWTTIHGIRSLMADRHFMLNSTSTLYLVDALIESGELEEARLLLPNSSSSTNTTKDTSSFMKGK